MDKDDPQACAGWLRVFKALELHVYVALADQELCDNIVAVLHRWITSFPPETRESEEVLRTFNTLGKSLKLVFNPENDPNEPAPKVCKNAAFELVRSLRASGPVFDEALNAALAELNDPIVNAALSGEEVDAAEGGAEGGDTALAGEQ
jgi:hypothetical protein